MYLENAVFGKMHFKVNCLKNTMRTSLCKHEKWRNVTLNWNAHVTAAWHNCSITWAPNALVYTHVCGQSLLLFLYMCNDPKSLLETVPLRVKTYTCKRDLRVCSSLGFVDERATIPKVFWTIGTIDGPRPLLRFSQFSVHGDMLCSVIAMPWYIIAMVRYTTEMLWYVIAVFPNIYELLQKQRPKQYRNNEGMKTEDCPAAEKSW